MTSVVVSVVCGGYKAALASEQVLESLSLSSGLVIVVSVGPKSGRE